MNTKKLPRPLQRASRQGMRGITADEPIPFVVTCKGMGLPWPTGDNVPTLQQIEEEYADLAGELQEGAPFNPGMFDALHTRYANAHNAHNG